MNCYAKKTTSPRAANNDNNNGTQKLGTLLMLTLAATALLIIATSQTICAAPTNDEPRGALQQRSSFRPLRFRRHAALASGQQAAKQLLEGDEQVLKRQLPDLIAQAHQDKAVERALLKMLINASLRSGLSNMVANSAGASSPSGAAAGNNWQLDNDNTLTQYSQVGDDFVPIRALRMEQPVASAGDLGQLDTSDLTSLTATIAQLNGRLQPLLEQQRELQQQQQQYQPSAQVDKREYIKPCSFNAISCVRRPFQVNK